MQSGDAQAGRAFRVSYPPQSTSGKKCKVIYPPAGRAGTAYPPANQFGQEVKRFKNLQSKAKALKSCLPDMHFGGKD
jgi:hypothetical protein